MSLKELGRRMRAARVYRGLTQEEVAFRTGVRQCTITTYENGQYEPKLSTLIKWCRAVDFDIRYLLEAYDDEDDRQEQGGATKGASTSGI